MSAITLHVNRKVYPLDVDPETPLLWILRDLLSLTGTKYSCGMGICGTCTVIVNGEPVHSCITPVSAVEGKEVTTIEGLSIDGSHPLQKAWIEEDVSQCGYCQPGQIMTAAALLERNPHPSRDEIVNAMAPVLCRCGTYPRVLKAVLRAAEEGGA